MSNISKILVIDSNNINLKIMANILTKEGFDILLSRNGSVGRELARNEIPDLIMLDVEMPEENGFKTCKLLKEEPLTSEIPVMFISSHDDTKSKVAALGLDAVDYITKPFHIEEVLARIKLHIRLNRSHKELNKVNEEKLNQLAKAQKAILLRPVDLPEANFQIFFSSMMEAGGDFYDVLNLGNNIYGYFCADVSGHDTGATLATASFKALIHQNAGIIYSPVKTMHIVNSTLLTVISEDKYLSAVYVLLNRNRNILKIASAGHPPVIILPRNKYPYYVEQAGDLLGLFKDVAYEQKNIKVNNGDRLFLYTDGLIEGFESIKVQRRSGINKLLEIINRNRDMKLTDLINYTIHEIYPDLSKQEDDILLMGVEI